MIESNPTKLRIKLEFIYNKNSKIYFHIYLNMKKKRKNAIKNIFKYTTNICCVIYRQYSKIHAYVKIMQI